MRDAVKRIEARAMRALDAAGRLLRDQAMGLVSVRAPRKRVIPPVLKQGYVLHWRARTPATTAAPPRIVNRILQRNLKSFRAGRHTVRVNAGAPWSAPNEFGKGNRHHPFLMPAYRSSKSLMWQVFCAVLRRGG